MPKALHCAEGEIANKGVSKIGTIRISDAKTDVNRQPSQEAGPNSRQRQNAEKYLKKAK